MATNPAPDELDEKFLEYLRNLKPDEQEKLAKQVSAMMHEEKEFEDKLSKARRKGLVEPEDMIFDVTFTVCCTTCGSQHVSMVKSSNIKPIVHGQPLCGKCRDVLMAQPLDQVVDMLIAKERAWLTRKNHEHVPQYIPPCERVFVLDVNIVQTSEAKITELFDDPTDEQETDHNHEE